MRQPSRARSTFFSRRFFVRRLLVSSLVVGVVAFSPGVALLSSGTASFARASARGDSALVQLSSQLDTILDDPRLSGATVAAVARAADTGAILYSRDAGRRLLPASNAKLLVAAAAFEVLGADHRFETAVLAAETPRAGLVEGDIYLRGGGDPTLLPDDFDRLASDLAASGLQVVGGDLVADDSWFDDVRLGADWAWDDEDRPYAAQVSALTVAPDGDFDAGTVAIDVSPGEAPGHPARVRLVPETDHVQLTNQALTGQTSSETSLSLDRQHGSNLLAIGGSIAEGAASRRIWASVWDPTGHASAVFRAALATHGIALRGVVRRGQTPSSASLLARRLSVPLAELLVPMLKLSNNGHAEVLVKAIGRRAVDRGTWEDGLAETARALARLGPDPAGLRIADGSGLSRRDLASPEQLAALLAAVQGNPWFPSFLAALPLAGHPDRLVGGTLRSRMREGPAAGNVRAKTGTLDSVSTLSGYVTTADGELLVFSLLLNNYLGPAPKGVEDAFASALAGFRRSADGGSNAQARGGGRSGGPEKESLRPAEAREQRAASPPGTPGAATLGLECSWIKAC